MNLSNANDNLNITFNLTAGATHRQFIVGSKTFPANYCPTLNTYVNNVTQDTHFEEMALYDGTNVVYSTNIDKNTNGFDSNSYDFQMIVPENGAPSWTSSTAYYLYVELD